MVHISGSLGSSYRGKPKEQRTKEEADVGQEHDTGLKHPGKREEVRCAM